MLKIALLTLGSLSMLAGCMNGNKSSPPPASAPYEKPIDKSAPPQSQEEDYQTPPVPTHHKNPALPKGEIKYDYSGVTLETTLYHWKGRVAQFREEVGKIPGVTTSTRDDDHRKFPSGCTKKGCLIETQDSYAVLVKYSKPEDIDKIMSVHKKILSLDGR